MPNNSEGDHYANPAYGEMMAKGGKRKKKGQSSPMYLVSLDITRSEKGFEVECHYEEEGSSSDAPREAGFYGAMHTSKVFGTAKEMSKFVASAFA